MFDYTLTASGPLFNKNGLDLDKLLNKAVDETADWSQNRIRRLTPVDTGALRSGWVVTPTAKLGVRIDNPVLYAPYIERRVGMVSQNIPAIKDRLASNISKQIDKIK